VMVSLESGTGPLRGTQMATVSDGVATFTNLADGTAETITLNFTSPGLISATSNGILVSPAAAHKLVIETPPASTATAGVAFVTQPVIYEEDQYGNLETTDSTTVMTAALESGTGPLEGTPMATVSDGVATFVDLADNKAETLSLKFTSPGLTTATSANIEVSPAAAYRLEIETPPSSTAMAGVAFAIQPVISEEDEYGNLEATDNSTVVTAALTTGTGPLRGTLTSTVSGGMATFLNLADNTAETLSLKFTSPDLATATSTNIVVSPAAADKLVIHTQPSAAATAGQAVSVQPVIYEEDQYGNRETTDSTTVVTAAIASGSGPLQGTPTATVLDGVATFTNLADDTAETISLGFTYPGLVTATSNNVVVSPAAAYQLVMHTQPSSTVAAGVAFAAQPVIYVEDKYGNLESRNNTTVATAGIESGAGPLQGTTMETAVDGVVTFANLADDTAEPLSLKFTSSGLVTATSNSIIVSPAAAYKLVVQIQPPAASTAGSELATQPVVYEEDQYGNLEETDDTTVVTAALGSGSGPLQGTAMATVSGGVATFVNLGDNTAETISLDFTSPGLMQATSNTILVSPAAATQLLIQTQPSSTAIAGQAFATQPVIYEEDQYGNLETSDNSTIITATANSGESTLQGMSQVEVSGGVARFINLADEKAEAVTLSFSTIANLQVLTPSTTTVTPATASQLVIQTQVSSSATAGQIFGTQPTIEEEDRYGNVESGDSSTVVTVSPTGAGGPLQGMTTATVAAGVATFTDLADDQAGNVELSFASGHLAAATAGPITIAPASAAALVVTQQPRPSITAGDQFGFAVTAEDRFGNAVPSFTGNVAVTAANNPSGATLNGSLIATASAGAASLTGLTLNTAAVGYTLRASTPGLTAAVTYAFDVVPAPATRLVVTGQPPATLAAESGFGLVVAAEDTYGNVVTSEVGTVTVGLSSGPGGTLSGPTTAALVYGVANLTGLMLSGAGDYSLKINGDGLTAAVSTAFSVIPPPTIIGERVLTTGKGKHKKSTGFELFFSAPLDPARAENAANFSVTQTVKHGHKTSAKPVAIQVVYGPAANSVSLLVHGKAPFTQGGKIVVNASPLNGILAASGAALDGNDEGIPGDNAVLTVLPKDRGITL
jgi:hypothetical protein